MVEGSPIATYTPEEVAKHNTVEDCWIVISGKVYDVSGYLDDHPGGGEVISDLAGNDTTEDFDDVGHSEEAIEQLADFMIGKIISGKESDIAEDANTQSQSQSQSPPTVTTKETTRGKAYGNERGSDDEQGTSVLSYAAYSVGVAVFGYAALRWMRRRR